MYRWIWAHLPGPTAARLLQAALLLVAVVWLLLFVVFPRVETLLPFTDVDVDQVTTGARLSRSAYESGSVGATSGDLVLH